MGGPSNPRYERGERLATRHRRQNAMSTTSAPSVGRQVAIGAAFMVLLRLVYRGIGFVSTLILVRLLEPADFGLVGLASVTYAVLDSLSELSLQMAVIRMKDPQ